MLYINEILMGQPYILYMRKKTSLFLMVFVIRVFLLSGF